MAAHGGTRAVIAALLANTGIAITKFVAWLLTGASSMLAESVHSVADAGNQVLLLVGGRRATRRATQTHPFGYGRVRYVYAFIVSNKIRGGVSWVQFVRRAKAPELPVILLEDLGALLGLTFALIGVGMALLTDNAYWDAAGTAAIGVLLVIIAIVLAIEMSSLLVGEGASEETVQAIEKALAADGSDRLIHLRTLYVGPEDLLVAAKIGVDATQSGGEIAQAIDAAEERVRAVAPEATTIYLEPDIVRKAPTGGGGAGSPADG